jgi:protein TonB
VIDWRDPDARPDRKITALSALRWALAVSLVVAAHGIAAWLALRWMPARASSDGPPPAVMIELAPLAVAPDAVPQEIAPGPQVTEAQPDPVPDPAEKLPEDERPEPPVEKVPTPVEEQPIVPAPLPQVEVPKLPEAPKAEAVLAPPPSKPKEEERKKTTPKQPASPQTSAPTVQAERANRIASPTASAAQIPSASSANWRSSLMAHLNRHKQFPAGGSQGVASIAFTIDPSGRVQSVSLVHSSGDSVLDREAVALARRASPVPAPPSGQGGSSVSISVPIRFDRR